MSKKLSFIILIILIIMAGVFLIFKTKKEKPAKTHEEKIQEKLEQANIKRIKGETHNTYINQETGYETKLPKGEFDFKVMGGGDKLPGFVSGSIDPVEVVPGDVQTMTVTIKDDVPLKRVWAEIETDIEDDIVEMKLINSGPLTFKDLNTYPYSISEDNKLVIHKGPEKKDTFISKITKKVHAVSKLKKYTYKAKWTVHDTHIKEYNTTFFALDEKDRQNNLTIAWFDPCEWFEDGHGLGDNCMISANAGGYDGASYTMTTNTILTLSGGKLLFNSGTSINLPGGSILLSGGSIEEGNLYQNDSDGDGWKDSITQYASGTYRSKDLRGVSGQEHWENPDCDASPDGGQYVQQTYDSYVYDPDEDAYTSDAAATHCLSTVTSVYKRKSNSGNWDYRHSNYLLGTSDCDNNTDGSTWQNLTGYTDYDGDGYGTGGGGNVCSGSSLPSSYADNSNDCNDGDSSVHPGQTDTCKSDPWGIGGSPEGDGYADIDCDGQTDEDSQCYCYDDDDNDGAFGGGPSWECVSSNSSSGSDCNDNNSSIVAANDGTCDGDSDGYTDDTAGGGDCDDGHSAVHPNQNDYCRSDKFGLGGGSEGDGFRDNDCDGSTDEDSQCNCHDDDDNDGYFGTGGYYECVSASSSSGSDCEDTNENVWNNGYVDSDGDGYGKSGTWGCNNGVGNNTDCNDDPDSGGEYVYRNVSSLVPDVDHDGYAGGSATTECVGNHWLSPAGRDYYRYYNGNYDEMQSADVVGYDCNDTIGTIYQNLCGYTDSDGDGYGIGTQNCSICSGSSLPNGYASNSTDCLDSDSSVHPGAGYHNSAGANNGDWNCSGSVEYQVSQISLGGCVENNATYVASRGNTEWGDNNCAAFWWVDLGYGGSFIGTIDTDGDGLGCDEDYMLDNCSNISMYSRSAYRK